PSYSEMGKEARVHPNSNKDLKVYNSSNKAYEIRARITDPELHLSLHAIPSADEYEFATEDPVYIKPRTIYRYSAALAPGQETIVQNGHSGVRLQIIRQRKNTSG